MDDNNYVRAIHIVEGLKVFMPNEKSCYKLETQLNDIGVQTRVGRNCEIDLWSVYIISIPDELDGKNIIFYEVDCDGYSERFNCISRMC